MTNYIINPAVFYWMNVLGILQTTLAVLGGFSLAIFTGLAIRAFYIKSNLHEPEKPEDYEKSNYEKRSYDRDLKKYISNKKE